jgi:hypothetical protein
MIYSLRLSRNHCYLLIEVMTENKLFCYDISKCLSFYHPDIFYILIR